MHEFLRVAFIIATASFLLSWATGAWNIALLWIRIRRDGRSRLPMRELFSTSGTVTSAYPEGRRFLQALLACAISWCVALVTGLSSGILH